ncbi:MAG: hypothetical protein IPO52_12490 [Gemmatimonadetes bacterium]|nr:hypothetical protein [Gemmatimonadota bacterium]
MNSCGVATDGGVYCWGFNGSRVVGRPDEYLFTSPQQVLGGHVFVQVGVGNFHSCGLKADGSTWCWGWNNYENVGSTAPPRVRQPVRVLGAPSFQAIDAGGESTCGLTPDGAVYCWGRGFNGEIGDGQFSNRATPTKANVPDGMVALSLGWGTGCALTSAGVAWCWGRESGFSEAQRPAVLPAPVTAPEPLTSISVGTGTRADEGLGNGVLLGRAPRHELVLHCTAAIRWPSRRYGRGGKQLGLRHRGERRREMLRPRLSRNADWRGAQHHLLLDLGRLRHRSGRGRILLGAELRGAGRAR